MDLDRLHTIDNPDKSRFELIGDELLAFIDYKIGKSGNWFLVHTEVVKKEQKGLGNKIVREALAILDGRGIKIVPSCPFIHAFIKRHFEDYKHILAEGVKL